MTHLPEESPVLQGGEDVNSPTSTHRDKDGQPELDAGRVIETGVTAALYARLAHPYMRDLLAAVPRLTSGHRSGSRPWPA